MKRNQWSAFGLALAVLGIVGGLVLSAPIWVWFLLGAGLGGNLMTLLSRSA